MTFKQTLYNDLPAQAAEPVKAIVYADDWSFLVSCKSIEEGEELMQETILDVHSVMMHICKLRPRKRPHPNTVITVDGEEFNISQTHKILGVTFDSRHTWQPNFNRIKLKVNGRINLLRILAGTAYGSDQDTLLRIHQAMILPVIEYGSVAYSSGNKTTLKQLNPIHHEGMRTALGAFRSSALEYLENESGLEDLERRRDRRTMNLGAKILAMANHPLQESMKERRETNDHHGFTQRARNLFDKYSIELQDLETINVKTHAYIVYSKLSNMLYETLNCKKSAVPH